MFHKQSVPPLIKYIRHWQSYNLRSRKEVNHFLLSIFLCAIMLVIMLVGILDL